MILQRHGTKNEWQQRIYLQPGAWPMGGTPHVGGQISGRKDRQIDGRRAGGMEEGWKMDGWLSELKE